MTTRQSIDDLRRTVRVGETRAMKELELSDFVHIAIFRIDENRPVFIYATGNAGESIYIPCINGITSKNGKISYFEMNGETGVDFKIHVDSSGDRVSRIELSYYSRGLEWEFTRKDNGRYLLRRKAPPGEPTAFGIFATYVDQPDKEFQIEIQRVVRIAEEYELME